MEKELFSGSVSAQSGKQLGALYNVLCKVYESDHSLTGTYRRNVDLVKQVKEYDAISGKNKIRKVDNSMYQVEKTTTFTTTFDKSYLEYPMVKAYQQGRADAGYEKKEPTTDYTYVNECVKVRTEALNGATVPDPMKLQINVDLKNGKDSISSTYKLYETLPDGSVTVKDVDKDFLIKKEIIRDSAPNKEADATGVISMTLSLAKITRLAEVIPDNN